MSLKENDKSLLSDPFLYQMGDDSHLYDATEKVLILRKTVQDKVYLYVFHYYILYVKTVFQWRPYRGGSHLPSDIVFKSPKNIKLQIRQRSAHLPPHLLQNAPVRSPALLPEIPLPHKGSLQAASTHTTPP